MPNNANLFKKAAVFTDIHFGLKSNSAAHLADCNEFIDWVISEAKAQGCETCIFTGDWHHNRSTINIVTLSHSLTALEKLNDNFDTVFFIPGNHDLYYKDRRDIQSTIWAKHIKNVEIINNITTIDNVTFVPWLVGDDYKRMRKLKTQYVFGHFELPHFFMNAMIRMPDHGDFNTDDLNGIGEVYSGHFHKRQQNGNVTYLGNAFAHNYADKDDDERGFMLLEWGKPPRFFNWLNGPTYRILNLSTILDDPDNILKPKMHVKINIDIPISYEEANFIKETFADKYNLREISLLPIKEDIDKNEIANITFDSVDQIVQQELLNIQSDNFNQEILMGIYQNI